MVQQKNEDQTGTNSADTLVRESAETQAAQGI